jgi:hypothetical protein
MKYRTLLEYEVVSKLKDELKYIYPSMWLLDLDKRAKVHLLGPFNTVAEAHNNRDYIWNYGDRYGRYMWLVNRSAANLLSSNADKIQHIEVAIDTLPLEVIGFKLKVENESQWIKTPSKRKIKQ